MLQLAAIYNVRWRPMAVRAAYEVSLYASCANAAVSFSYATGDGGKR